MMTAPYRAAALQYGRSFRITLPVPDGTTTVIERAHGCFSYVPKYIPESIGTPRCGWSVTGYQSRVWHVSQNPVVFQFGACE